MALTHSAVQVGRSRPTHLNWSCPTVRDATMRGRRAETHTHFCCSAPSLPLASREKALQRWNHAVEASDLHGLPVLPLVPVDAPGKSRSAMIQYRAARGSVRRKLAELSRSVGLNEGHTRRPCVCT